MCAFSVKRHRPKPWKGRGHVEAEGKVKLKESFATSLAKFIELGTVPLNVIPEQFNDVSGNEEQMNTSKWHTTCPNL